MRKPTNTTKETYSDPYGFLLDAMVRGSDNAILNQESRGQRELVHSDTLPTKINGKEVLEKFGFKFLGPVEGDPLFQYVEMPKGWKKVPTDHSMWSSLVDDKGRKRGAIFYKAAFYDREAHMTLERRYAVRFDYEQRDKNNVAIAHVYDGDKIIYSTVPLRLTATPNTLAWYNQSDEATENANKWMVENFPQWEDVSAYWEG